MRKSGWKSVPMLLALLLVANVGIAQSERQVRKQVEATMLVTGQVTIEEDGSVSGWKVDQREKLPEVVAGLVDRAIPEWRFEPVVLDGKPTRGTASMSLRLLADQLEDGRYQVSIASGYFGRDALSLEERKRRGYDQDHVRALDMKPPRYPVAALQVGAQGTVYTVIRIGRHGTVEDVAVEQVNLRTVATEREMQRLREMFSKRSIEAARKWTFQIPTTGEWANEESWAVRVPVDYILGDPKVAGYGEWQAYVPGPRMPIPWAVEHLDGFDVAPDALVAGQVHQVGTGLKLLTPLQGG